MYYDFWPVINVVKVCWLGLGTKTTQLGQEQDRAFG